MSGQVAEWREIEKILDRSKFSLLSSMPCFLTAFYYFGDKNESTNYS